MSDDWNELFDRILPDAEGEDLTDEDVERSLLHGMSDEDIEAVRRDSPMDEVPDCAPCATYQHDASYHDSDERYPSITDEP